MKLVKTTKPSGPRKKNTLKNASAPVSVATPAPAAAASTAGQTAVATPRTVEIEAKVDVGFGNALYLRGEGKGLSWNQGIPLTCIDGSTWKWAGTAEDKLKFKLLLNDMVWAAGEDLVAAPGDKLQVSPSFN